MLHHDNYDTTEALTPRGTARSEGLSDGGQWIAEAALPVAIEAQSHVTDPVIARFRAALKRVQTAELDRLYDRLPDLDEHSRHAICQFADGLVAKMLHPPLESLRSESRNGYPDRLLDALQRLFRLDD